MLPLWGFSIGLDAQTIALVVGISGAIDFALFYASGQVMDRFGRLWAALPAMVLMGAGFLALAFTHDLDSAAMWFAMFAAVLGVGNGLSSGILLTLGADVAPQGRPGAVPRLVAHAHRRGRRDLAAARLGASRRCRRCRSRPAPSASSALLGGLAFLRWVPRFVPRADVR